MAYSNVFPGTKLLRYDTTTGAVEAYDGTQFVPIQQGLDSDTITTDMIIDGSVTSDKIAAGDQFHNRYASQASTQRAAGSVTPITCEVYYTARPDGDGYSEGEETATPPAGARIVRRFYYSDKFNADPTVGADWTAYTTQPADGTSFATAKASLLAGLNDTDATANTRGTLPVSLKMEYEAVVDRLLNDYPGAEAAYSVRLIDKNYSGYCMRVRNVNTNATADIGFDVDGNLDEGAIATLCGAYNGAVEIWYDQSGGGHHQVQETTTLQPFIYFGGNPGTVLKENGKPVIVFTDGGQLQNVAHSTVTVNITTPVEADGADSGYTFCVVGPGGDYSTYSNFIIGTTSGGGTRFGFCTTTGTGTPDASFTCTHTVNGTTQSSPTQASLYAAIDPQAVVTTDWLITDYSARAWYLNYNYPFAGSLQVQEYVIYYSDKSSDQAAIEADIDAYYQPTTRLLLDDYRGAAAAYSVRKLSQWHTGSCMRIREDSGNTETDIGFDINGDLDTAAIKSFCDAAGSGVNGYVVTWYDQSGNGQDVTQATAANQPQIYNGTAVLTDNGKPCIEFDTNGALVTSNSAFSGTSQSMFVVCNSDTNHTTDVIVGLGPNAGYKTRRLSASHQLEVVFNNKNWSGVTGSQQLLSLIPDGGATTISDYDLYRDGSLLTPTATLDTQNLQSCAGGTIYVGGVSPINTSYAFDGKMQEVVLWNSDQSSNRTGVESNINTYFSIYP